jgi:hypothetical protein
MIIEGFSAFAATVLAVSLATERLVAFVKSAAPRWFADEKKTEASEVDLLGDSWRRIRVHAVALVSAWLASASLPEGGFALLGKVVLSAGNIAIPVPLLALLSMGGSAFWTSIVGYASTAKDLRMQERSSQGLKFRADAKEHGVIASDAGIAAVARAASQPAPGLSKVLETMAAISPPAFDTPTSRVASHG